MISVVIGSAPVERGVRAVCAISGLLSCPGSRDQDIAVPVERGNVPGRHDGRRALLLDHDWALVTALLRQSVAHQHRRFVLGAVEDDRPRCPSSGSALSPAPEYGVCAVAMRPIAANAQVDELDRSAGCGVSIARPVNLVEVGVDLLEIDRGTDRNVDRVLLSDVAHVGGARGVPVVRADSLPLEQRCTLALRANGRRPRHRPPRVRLAAGRSSGPRRGAYPSAACPRRRTYRDSRGRSPRRSPALRRARRRASGRLRRRRRVRTRAGRSPA